LSWLSRQLTRLNSPVECYLNSPQVIGRCLLHKAHSAAKCQ